MTTSTEPCPSCGRPNVSWRVSCLYCGAKMPNPGPPPPPKAVPDNLDALIRDAMRGGSTDAVRKALQDARPPAAEAAQTTPPRPPSTARDDAPAAPALTPPGTDLDASTLPTVLVHLEAAARDAAAHADDPIALDRALSEVEAWVRQARGLAGPPAPRAVVLPPIRHPYALVIDGVGDPEQGAALARALEVDAATARAAAAVRYIHIALRGAEPDPLARRAAAVNATLPIRASVVARAALFEIPAALAVVGRDPDGRWRVVDLPLWEEGIDPSQRPPGDAVQVSGVSLAVTGEVEVKAGRSGSEPSRWLRQGYAADPVAAIQRVSVLDLHAPSGILRITPTVTAFEGFPGNDPTSTARSFKQLVDALAEVFPGIRVEPRRVCPASNAAGDARYTSGWAAWEEHTRIARLHALP